MKVEFKPKTTFEISDIDKIVESEPNFVQNCETEYEKRIEDTAKAIILSGASFVMVSGPSASGKTTSSRKLAIALRRLGRQALVVSLDDFFKNIENYPKNAEGNPDLESVYAVDIECVNAKLKELLETGKSEFPQFDFHTEHRMEKTRSVELAKDGVMIIEGIHALNPLLSQSIPDNSVYRLYVSVRTEYTQNNTRVLATRDLRITRRMVRDFYFRGKDVSKTLGVWQELMDGEEKWIKPFKPIADSMLDTSFPYEPCVFLPMLKMLKADENQGGVYRDTLLRLCGLFELFEPIEAACVPNNSMLREFLGGLELEDDMQ